MIETVALYQLSVILLSVALVWYSGAPWWGVLIAPFVGFSGQLLSMVFFDAVLQFPLWLSWTAASAVGIICAYIAVKRVQGAFSN